MAEKYFGGEIDIGRIDAGASSELEEQCTYAHMNVHRKEYWSHLHFSLMLENIWDIIGETNNYIARKEPWKLAKGEYESIENCYVQYLECIANHSALALSFYARYCREDMEAAWLEIFG